MKLSVVILVALLPFISVDAQIVQADKLDYILKQCNSDSVKKTERLAALKFHQLINEYRKKNKLDTLAWDDSLWLTCRNHNIWMAENNKLSHTQSKNTKDFTGEHPGDRYQYATANKGRSSWSGENALYNYNTAGSTINEISQSMGNAAFNQWKNSPGHDQNMRAPQSHSHGTAFLMESQGIVWATDLFSYNGAVNKAFNQNNELAVLEKTPITKASAKKKIRIKDANELTSNLLAALYNTSTAKINKAKTKAAQLHANYIASNKMLSHVENKNMPGYYGVTPKQRLLKASVGMYFFIGSKTPLAESIAKLELTELPNDISAFTSTVISVLNDEKQMHGIPVSVGYGVAFKQLKNSISIYVVRLEQVKPGNQFNNELSIK